MLLKLLLALAEPKNKKVKPQKKTATQKAKEKAELERRLSQNLCAYAVPS